MRLLASLLLLSASLLAALPANASLAPFTARYSARYNGIPASGVMVLSPRGNQWTLAMNLENVAAAMSQATLFSVSRNGLLMPLGGSDTTSYLGKRKSVPARFNWSTLQASWSGDAKASRRGPVAIRAGDVDGLLLQLALARDVPAGRPLNYRVIENGKGRPMAFRRAGTETIRVDGRPLDTTRVVASAGGKTTTAWIAAGVPIPVRLVQADGSETVTLDLVSWR